MKRRIAGRCAALAGALFLAGCNLTAEGAPAASSGETASPVITVGNGENLAQNEEQPVSESVTESTELQTEESTEPQTEESMELQTGGTEMSELQTTTYQINGIDFKMILVEAGTFTMGSDDPDTAFCESPAHQVTLTHDYLMGETEVTETQWNAVMGGSRVSGGLPKTSVTWKQVHSFVDRLNETAHAQGIIGENENFRLPTEAQWEFAAKGGNLSRGYRYSGSDNIDEVAQTLENTGSDSPVAVKQKAPNELGLYDMSGNAYEWVDDYAGEYSAEAQTDPQNTVVSGRYVKRGGSNYHAFRSEPYLFTTTGRYFYGGTDWTIGFRLCLVTDR